MGTTPAKRALITGAGRRIGHHVASRLLDDGYEVLAVTRSPTEALEALGARGATTALVDLTEPAQIASLVDEHAAFFASLHLLVNNASDYGPTRRSHDEIVTDFERYFRIHMLAPYLLGEAFHERAQGEHDRAIVNVTDLYAERPRPATDIYCATKAGLANLTVSQALRYAPRIRVNALAPGPVLRGEHPDASKADVLAQTPMAREGGAESVYRAIAYLASADFVTGTTLPVDGGRRHTYVPG